MDALRQERKQRRRENGRAMGQNTYLERTFAVQINSSFAILANQALPIGDCEGSGNVTDPGDPDFGKERFIAGISTPGDGSVMK